MELICQYCNSKIECNCDNASFVTSCKNAKITKKCICDSCYLVNTPTDVASNDVKFTHYLDAVSKCSGSIDKINKLLVSIFL